MEGLRIFKNLKSKKILIIIFWIICCFITTNVNKVKAQEEQLTDPFMATLTIQRTDCIQTDSANKASLEFGFATSIQLIPGPPGPPAECIKAFFDHDPNITGFASLEEDSNQPRFIKDLNSLLDSGRDSCDGWQRAIFPLPDPEPDQQWKATWGIMISYPDLMLYDPNVHPLEISWDPNKLVSGDFQLKISNQSFDMHEKSKIQVENIENGAILKIIYSPEYSPVEPPPVKQDTSVLSIICIGEQLDTPTDVDAFLSLGGNSYKNIQNHPNISLRINQDNDIRFIYYKTYYDIDEKRGSEVFLNGLCQKDALQDSIKNWIPDRLSNPKPGEAIIFIYLVDHGESIGGGEDGKIYLDPLNPDPKKRSLSGSEFKNWLDYLRENLPKKDPPEQETPIKNEIYVIVEACHSKSFVNQIESGDSGNYILVASASEDESAIIFDQGRLAFTWFFWEGVNKVQNKTLDDLFNYADNKFKEKFYPYVPNQTPYLFKGNNIGDTFILDKLLSEIVSDLPSIPVIKDVAGTLEITESFTSKLNFTVFANEGTDIDKAWAAIIPPCCSEDKCRFYTDPNASNCNGSECTFSYACDYFLPPGTEVYIYIKGENTPSSVPYIHRPKVDLDEDSFEPDDNSKQANLSFGEFQNHSFHDPNDIDWFVFFTQPGLKDYQIKLILPSALVTNPNILPFHLTIFTDNEMIDNVKRLDRYQDQQDQDHLIYWWENTKKDSKTINLKITSAKGCNTIFPYQISIAPEVAEKACQVCSQVNKAAKNKIEAGIMSVYLLYENGDKVFDKQGNEYSLGWLKSSIVNSYNPCKPEYFCFFISPEHATTSCFYLYVKEGTIDEKQGPKICINSEYETWLDPNLYFSDSEIPSWDCDSDCDGRTDFEEQQDGNEETIPDHPEVILHSGMNVFRYPFLGEYCRFPDSTKKGVDLYTIFHDSNAIIYNPILIKLNKSCIFSKEEKSWDCYNMNIFDFNENPPEIFLENNSASLIYLDSDQEYNIISLPYGKEKSGLCYPEVLNDHYVQGKAKILFSKITVYQGLNLVSFFGYKAISGSLIPVDDGSFHSFSAARSLKEASSGTDSMNFSSIMRYDNNQGKWQQSSLFFGRPSGDLFPIQSQEGYLIYMNRGASGHPSIDWLPDQIWSDMQYQIKENE